MPHPSPTVHATPLSYCTCHTHRLLYMPHPSPTVHATPLSYCTCHTHRLLYMPHPSPTVHATLSPTVHVTPSPTVHALHTHVHTHTHALLHIHYNTSQYRGDANVCLERTNLLSQMGPLKLWKVLDVPQVVMVIAAFLATYSCRTGDSL